MCCNVDACAMENVNLLCPLLVCIVHHSPLPISGPRSGFLDFTQGLRLHDAELQSLRLRMRAEAFKL